MAYSPPLSKFDGAAVPLLLARRRGETDLEEVAIASPDGGVT
jgi:hypothetical protein